MRKVIFLFAICVSLGLTSCSKEPSARESGAKESAEPVSADDLLEAMYRCPNEELFNPEALTVIGLGVEETLDKDEKELAKEEETENWKEQFGSLFTEEGFENFIGSGDHIFCHFLADYYDCTVEVKEIKKEKESDTGFVYTISLLVRNSSGTETETSVRCRLLYNDSGDKIESVEVIDDKELAERLLEAAG